MNTLKLDFGFLVFGCSCKKAVTKKKGSKKHKTKDKGKKRTYQINGGNGRQ